ncbi:MAG: hypothetical protein AABY84_02230 [Candidatus Firestonebacteria bacterium]
MSAKVFISCGQKNSDEISIAGEIKSWLEKQGFMAYVAKETHSFEDTKKSIIFELENSNYYLFIDFKRERICESGNEIKYRGSLFSHQELALASYVGFGNTIFIQEKDVEQNGFLGYILSNPVVFNNKAEVLSLVENEVKEHNWDKNYSRHLIPESICKNGPFIYNDQQGQGQNSEYIWSCRIQNKNTNRDARNVKAILSGIKNPKDNNVKPFIDGKYLKWAGHYMCFEQTIPRLNSRRLDLFSIYDNRLFKIYLHDDSDESRTPVNDGNSGDVYLEYSVYAQDFPVLRFVLKVKLTGNIKTTTAEFISGYKKHTC